jgi:hypothetical protein
MEVREMSLDSHEMFAKLNPVEIFAIAMLLSEIYHKETPWARSGGDMKLCVIKLFN